MDELNWGRRFDKKLPNCMAEIIFLLLNRFNRISSAGKSQFFKMAEESKMAASIIFVIILSILVPLRN
jgi:hypothetical protein